MIDKIKLEKCIRFCDGLETHDIDYLEQALYNLRLFKSECLDFKKFIGCPMNYGLPNSKWLCDHAELMATNICSNCWELALSVDEQVKTDYIKKENSFDTFNNIKSDRDILFDILKDSGGFSSDYYNNCINEIFKKYVLVPRPTHTTEYSCEECDPYEENENE